MTEVGRRYCVIIPVYRHERSLVHVLESLKNGGLACFIVDDGNEVPLSETLAKELTHYPWVKALRLTTHQGKGAACSEGVRVAHAEGYTHAIFVDADGQHDVRDIPRILTLSQEHSQAMILGNPVFDQSAPSRRRFGRMVSNAWVWIETGTMAIQDSLCGFRCFPLEPFLKVISNAPTARRMAYDPDIVVRLFWQGVPVVNFNTRVDYPSDGVSNFNLWRDNVALFGLHTRLFFEMLLRHRSFLMRRRSEAK